MPPVFRPARILIPHACDLSRWAVVACDQFTSDPAYWKRVKEHTDGVPSALDFILPEAWLGTSLEAEHQKGIEEAMQKSLEPGFFDEYAQSFVYVERTLANGSVRRGLVGMVDLEAYDYTGQTKSPVRATEATILERIPPRKAIRQKAPLEIPHVLLLCDDEQDLLLSAVEEGRNQYGKIYDFNLMEEGGRIRGWLVSEPQSRAFLERLEAYQHDAEKKYKGFEGENLVFAVGDGNHSLATAKAIWEELKPSLSPEERAVHPARFALAELENIHDDSQRFEPIHRIVKNVDPEKLLKAARPYCTTDPLNVYPVGYTAGGQAGILYLDPDQGEMAVAVLQKYLDDYLADNPGEIDYIHGIDALQSLSRQENAVGFLLPAIEKSSLFRGVLRDGALPRKTFSMGHAQEKRYYLECRKIR